MFGSLLMVRRMVLALSLLALGTVYSLHTALTTAQTRPAAGATTAPSVPRAIRRDVPLTNAIRRAYDAGTRDMTGRPGPNYWQLQTDYAINARLDPATQTITGTETITLHNNSPLPLAEILLRLDHNIYRGLVPRGGSVPAENTEGMVVTRLSVNGEAVDLDRTGGRGTRRRCRAPPVRLGIGSDAGASLARDSDRRQVNRQDRDRMAHETSGWPERPRPPHDAAH